MPDHQSAPMKFDSAGWARLSHPDIAAWAAAAQGPATVGIAGQDWRCGGTWCVGLDALPNTADGSVAGVPLPWDVLGARLGIAPMPLHRAQVSVVRQGYPQPSADETSAAFGYRLNRDAAHLDGLLPVGPDRRRMVKEPHTWILGLPLNACTGDAAPLVVWEGSHAVMRAALLPVLSRHAPGDWGNVDITDAYTAARRTVFDTCRRVELPGIPGEAVLLHRLILHGVAPWAKGAQAPEPGRMIAYFRPVMASVADWLLAP
jgi:hypothetical protein